MSRSPEEREAARLEREARRAKRSGETADRAAVAPVDPVRYDPEDFVTAPGEPEPRALGEAAGEATQAFEIVFDEPEPEAEATFEHLDDEPVLPPLADEVPMGVKRLGQPGPADGSAARRQPSSRGGPIGAYSRLKHKPRGVPKSGRGLKRKGSISLLVITVLVLWFVNALAQPFKGDGSGSVTVTIPSGASVSDVADLLDEGGVISSKFFFELRARISDPKFVSGTFNLKKDMAYGAVFEAIAKTTSGGPTVSYLIPEGKSRSEAARILKAAGLEGNYLTASKRSSALRPRTYKAPRNATLEGFLFPATYELKRGSDAKALVSAQLRAFKTNFATVDLTRAKRKNLTAFDVLTIASMVEREASIASERPLVAAVIYNRLKDGTPLGIDATTRFAVNNWDSPLKQSEIASTSPYNTRRVKGLPPGPIGSPGLASIKAAANPANVGYLFYVVKPCADGKHAFSSTNEQFGKDVAAYDRERAARGGKDPSSSKGCRTA
ncbi:MAG TPA: endolytic transglycosylase MltG [Baekduia sp.]|nr:endolytic transglycosylase MltG [Baekduia sp.]